MKTVIHKADSRGFADHGWLKARHSFSFASWYDPSRIHFGMLRVLNDDIIEGGKGFGTHPHDNMEIITIPLQGKIAHRDSAGHGQVTGPGEVQGMSAGTGIMHSEFNHSETEALNLLQLWIFTDTKGHEPRYDHRTFDLAGKKDRWQILVNPKDNGAGLWIHQNAWLSIAEVSEGNSLQYKIYASGNGVYAFVIEGAVAIAGEKLQRRDAVGLTQVNDFIVQAETAASILLIEVPLR